MRSTFGIRANTQPIAAKPRGSIRKQEKEDFVTPSGDPEISGIISNTSSTVFVTFSARSRAPGDPDIQNVGGPRNLRNHVQRRFQGFRDMLSGDPKVRAIPNTRKYPASPSGSVRVEEQEECATPWEFEQVPNKSLPTPGGSVQKEEEE